MLEGERERGMGGNDGEGTGQSSTTRLSTVGGGENLGVWLTTTARSETDVEEPTSNSGRSTACTLRIGWKRGRVGHATRADRRGSRHRLSKLTQNDTNGVAEPSVAS